MTERDVDQILRKLAEDAEHKAELKQAVMEIKGAVGRVERKATETNGRVTKIERERAVEKALNDQDREEEKSDREQRSGRNTAGWGAVYATVGLGVIYTLLELAHHVL